MPSRWRIYNALGIKNKWIYFVLLSFFRNFVPQRRVTMAILHIFNLEHDIALASNLANFTAPHAGRQLRADLGFLPVLWASEGDVVLVDNVEHAQKASRRLRRRAGVQFASVPPQEIDGIQVWGWDKALKAQLKRKGCDPSLLPSDVYLEHIRLLSHRRTSARLLPLLQMQGTVGESYECTKSEEVEMLFQKYGQVVMKTPWSSSGRGVRFCDATRLVNSEKLIVNNWFRNVISRQGSIMVEPYYDKIKDFGMEFSADGQGHIHYEGLSLFHTVNGAYVGNILATERAKQEMLSLYIPDGFISCIREKIISLLDLGDYAGPFGIDMMIVKSADGFLLHPCVEINLRRTMGHVALSLTPDDDEVVKVMRIELTDHYKLKINKL